MEKGCDCLVNYIWNIYMYVVYIQKEKKNSSKRVAMRKNGYKLNIDNGHEEKWL